MAQIYIFHDTVFMLVLLIKTTIPNDRQMKILGLTRELASHNKQDDANITLEHFYFDISYINMIITVIQI